METENIKNNEKGMSALLVVVIISAVSLIMAKSIAFLSLSELEMGDKESHGQKIFFAADACIEEALYRLRLDNSHAVNDKSVSINDIDCRYSVDIDGQNRNIAAIADSGAYERAINVIAAIENDQVEVVSFEIGE